MKRRLLPLLLLVLASLASAASFGLPGLFKDAVIPKLRQDVNAKITPTLAAPGALTNSPTPTISSTPTTNSSPVDTLTPTPTLAFTDTYSPTISPTATTSPTPVDTDTATPTGTPTMTATRTATPAGGIYAGYVDLFPVNNSGWLVGGSAVPATSTSGGPNGSGYFTSVATGLAGAGGRQVAFNTTRWTGNFTGLTSIILDARTSDALSRPLRIAFTGGGVQYCSINSVNLPNDGNWHTLTFTLGVGSLQGATATASVDKILLGLASVTQFRLISAVAPAYAGDQIASSIDYTNITAWNGAIPAPAGQALYYVAQEHKDLVKLNLSTGAEISRVPMTLTDTGASFSGTNGLARDPSNGDFYVVLRGYTSSVGRVLGIVDEGTGLVQLVGDMGVNTAALAFDAAGNLYAGTGGSGPSSNSFFSVNKSTAAISLLLGGFNSCGLGLAFDPLDSRIYAGQGCNFNRLEPMDSPYTSLGAAITPYGQTIAAEMGAMTYYTEGFMLWGSSCCDSLGTISLLSPSGYSVALFNTGDFVKGLVVAP